MNEMRDTGDPVSTTTGKSYYSLTGGRTGMWEAPPETDEVLTVEGMPWWTNLGYVAAGALATAVGVIIGAVWL